MSKKKVKLFDLKIGFYSCRPLCSKKDHVLLFTLILHSVNVTKIALETASSYPFQCSAVDVTFSVYFNIK